MRIFDFIEQQYSHVLMRLEICQPLVKFMIERHRSLSDHSLIVDRPYELVKSFSGNICNRNPVFRTEREDRRQTSLLDPGLHIDLFNLFRSSLKNFFNRLSSVNKLFTTIRHINQFPRSIEISKSPRKTLHYSYKIKKKLVRNYILMPDALKIFTSGTESLK